MLRMFLTRHCRVSAFGRAALVAEERSLVTGAGGSAGRASPLAPPRQLRQGRMPSPPPPPPPACMPTRVPRGKSWWWWCRGSCGSGLGAVVPPCEPRTGIWGCWRVTGDSQLYVAPRKMCNAVKRLQEQSV